MDYAKIILKPISPFITELQSDTIFGHFAWGVRFLYGEERLKELLEDFEKNPFIIFSDGFLKGFLAKPLLKYIPKDEEMKNAKKVKKSALIDKNFLFENIESLSGEKIFEFLKNSKNKVNIQTSITQKNSVNRLSNLVEEGLYSIKEKFIENEFEIYFAYQNISQKEIEEVFSFIAKRGYGKDKSTGKGRFEFNINWNFKEKEFFKYKKGYKYLNLSSMFISDNMHLLAGKTITKFPKAGGFYAGSEPFKNPCVMYLPGSIFEVNEGILGKAENTYNKKNHYQNGFSIGIFFKDKQ